MHVADGAACLSHGEGRYSARSADTGATARPAARCAVIAVGSIVGTITLVTSATCRMSRTSLKGMMRMTLWMRRIFLHRHRRQLDLEDYSRA